MSVQRLSPRAIAQALLFDGQPAFVVRAPSTGGRPAFRILQPDAIGELGPQLKQLCAAWFEDPDQAPDAAALIEAVCQQVANPRLWVELMAPFAPGIGQLGLPQDKPSAFDGILQVAAYLAERNWCDQASPFHIPLAGRKALRSLMALRDAPTARWMEWQEIRHESVPVPGMIGHGAASVLAWLRRLKALAFAALADHGDERRDPRLAKHALALARYMVKQLSLDPGSDETQAVSFLQQWEQDRHASPQDPPSIDTPLLQDLMDKALLKADPQPLLHWLQGTRLPQLNDADLHRLLNICCHPGFDRCLRRELLLLAFHHLVRVPGADWLRPGYESAIQRMFNVLAVDDPDRIVADNRRLALLYELGFNPSTTAQMEQLLNAQLSHNQYLNAHQLLFHTHPAPVRRRGAGSLQFALQKAHWSTRDIAALATVCEAWGQVGAPDAAICLLIAITAALPPHQEHLPLLRQCKALRDALEPLADTSLGAASQRKRSALPWLSFHPKHDKHTDRVKTFGVRVVGVPPDKALARTQLLRWIDSELLNPQGAQWEALQAVIVTVDQALQLGLEHDATLWLTLATQELRRGNGMPAVRLLLEVRELALNEAVLQELIDACASQLTLPDVERLQLLKSLIPLLPKSREAGAHADWLQAIGGVGDAELRHALHALYRQAHEPDGQDTRTPLAGLL